MTDRRPHGTGSLIERTDKSGRVTYKGQWRSEGKHICRTLGVKKQPGSKEGLTRAKAEAEFRRLRDEVKAEPSITEAMTIDELGRRYLAHLKDEGRKRSTLTGVESGLRVHLEPFFGARPIETVTRVEVRELIAALKQKGVGPKSIHNYLGTLSALYRYAMDPDNGWATSNPCDRVKLPRVPKYAGIRFLELDQIDTLVSNAQSGTYEALDAALYRTAAMTGLRLGELIALRWRDVAWPISKIHVRSNYVLGEYVTPKSDESERSVPMADEVAAALDALHKTGGEPADSALVFDDPSHGGPLSKAAVLRRMRRALKAAGLDETHRFHDLRHTFGTAIAKSGVPMRTLQGWMGHANLSTTEHYASFAPGHKDAEQIAAAFARDTVQDVGRVNAR
jgi:integrase